MQKNREREKEEEKNLYFPPMRTHQKRGLLGIFLALCAVLLALMIRLGVLMIGKVDYYGVAAREVQERERSIKAERGKILDRNGVELATNKAVATISVIHSQVTDPEKVISVLSKELELEEAQVRKKVEKVSSMERIQSNVEKETAAKIRKYQLDGVMIDEDYKRWYPFDTLASKVIGFTGRDNQGIIGLEVKYEELLKGTDGTIYTLTNAKGQRLSGKAERRKEPIPGNTLYTSLDYTIQKYAQQLAEQVRKEKNAKSVKMILLNPQNGEIYAMVHVPEFDLNDPFTLVEQEEMETDSGKLSEKQNEMWRNGCISDTYEPGSTFKIITAVSALSEGKVKVSDSFYCPGYKIVEDRRIRCHKTVGHGAETFREGIMNSCNPVFIEIAERTGRNKMYYWYERLSIFEKTGIDLPGEANSIFHKKKNVGEVELATMAFGQSIQITPMQLLRAACAVVNGGTLVTPHIGVKVVSSDGQRMKPLEFEEKKQVVGAKESETMCQLLEAVVSEGGGKNAYIEGYSIGGKTATSEKLPRRSGKYISSFLGFAPVQDPQVIALILIDEPEGAYYGGVIAAPVIKTLYENILPYLDMEPVVTVQE